MRLPTSQIKPNPSNPRIMTQCRTCSKLFFSRHLCATRQPKYCSKKCFALSPRSEYTRQKQSLSKKGKTPWNLGINMWAFREHPRGTLGMRFFGRGNGISSKNELARKSQDYRKWRTAVYERDNYTCKECGKRGGRLHPDHIKPFAYYKELRFDVDNGRTLCVECHYKTDTYGSKALKYAI